MPIQPNHLSILGIIHTAISVIALLVAFFALFKEGKINPENGRGKLYVLLTIVTCITALPIMKTGHPTAAHFVAIIILILLPIGIYAKSVKLLGKSAGYIQIIVMSTTLFFSFIPATIETLTRLPISHPLADGPNSPIIQTGLLTLVILYFAGVVYQLIKLSARRKSAQTPDSTIKFS
jgi:membrane-associated HD superfamily phosphohydrolase